MDASGIGISKLFAGSCYSFLFMNVYNLRDGNTILKECLDALCAIGGQTRARSHKVSLYIRMFGVTRSIVVELNCPRNTTPELDLWARRTSTGEVEALALWISTRVELENETIE